MILTYFYQSSLASGHFEVYHILWCQLDTSKDQKPSPRLSISAQSKGEGPPTPAKEPWCGQAFFLLFAPCDGALVLDKADFPLPPYNGPPLKLCFLEQVGFSWALIADRFRQYFISISPLQLPLTPAL